MLPRLNSKCASLGLTIEDDDGFELYRRVIREETLAIENQDFHIGLEIQRLAQTESKNIGATKTLIRAIDAKVGESLEKAGTMPKDELLVRVLWAGMDEESAEHAEKEGVGEGSCSCKELKEFLLRRFARKEARKTLRGKGPSAMDVDSFGQKDQE